MNHILKELTNLFQLNQEVCEKLSEAETNFKEKKISECFDLIKVYKNKIN